MRIHYLDVPYFESIAMASSFKRIGKGEYVLEHLHDGSRVPGTQLYLVTKTFKVGFLSSSSYTKVQPMNSEEASDWICKKCGDNAYAELLLQQENAKGYYKAIWGYNGRPLLGRENDHAEKR